MLKLAKRLILCGLLVLTGCTSFPPNGQGGMAEYYLDYRPEHPLGPAQGLHFELDLSRRYLDTLVLEGAKRCFPASVSLAKTREVRMVRALQGGLEDDLNNDLIIQRQQLAKLERRLDYVLANGSCSTPYLATQASTERDALASREPSIEKPTISEQISEQTVARITALLNSDNQFAVDSMQLNPKYVAHLAEATVMLRDFPPYLLTITGHSDASGSTAHNDALSLARAQQVQSYLKLFGLPSMLTTTLAKGSASPMFSGDDASVKLVNRRVNIELTSADLSGATQTTKTTKTTQAAQAKASQTME